ncbi:MAG: DUF262 domain-containing protein [Holophagaceae bacterium]|nr:DUF262 domain-containing protein [Holophagaceae bacterium]
MAKTSKAESQISDEHKIRAEQQIRDLQTIVDYDTKEYTVELIVQKYKTGIDDDENELFVPQYQRDFVWDERRQSKFIESVMLGLPVPYIFTASLSKEVGEDEGRIEIVDGSQRVRTLANFTENTLSLTGLEKLSLLNGFRFSDLDLGRQRKFNRRPIRVIELSDKADESVRIDIFERINTGSDELKDMEKRKGIYVGPFYSFVLECSESDIFKKLCPISHRKQRREEAPEMVLRYFAYANEYKNFKKSVRSFLDEYIKSNQVDFPKVELGHEFFQMLNFVELHFPNGFRKNSKNTSVPRVRFEAISVGVTLALRAKPDLVPIVPVDSWLYSDEFIELTVSDASNSKPRVAARIEYVRDRLLDL